MDNQTVILERINELIQALQQNYWDRTEDKTPSKDRLDHEIQMGKKYIKLIQISWGSRSIHAFIDKTTGEVYKPASFFKPAKHVRYKLLDDQSFQQCINVADWAGGYLYIR